jgi:hypothetical protein
MNAITILLVVFFAVWSLVPIWLHIRKARIRYEHEYDIKYKRIEKLIRECEINERNYVWIHSLLHHLGQLPHKNHEKTEVLSLTFWVKYHKMAKKEVTEVLERVNIN